jgi:hypothetical protein
MAGMPEADSMIPRRRRRAPGELPWTEQNPIEALGVDSLIDVGG